MKFLLINCGDPDPAIAQAHGRYIDWYRAALTDAIDVSLFEARQESPTSARLDGFDALLISGSPHSVYDTDPWIAATASLVREAIFGRSMPVLGVCFGHQLIAHYCGGRVVRNPLGREIGTATIELNAAGRSSALFAQLAPRFDAQLTHRDTVAEPPPGAVVLASSALDACQAFAFKSAWGVQFHPEFTADVIRSYLNARRALIEGEGLDADALLAGVRNTDAGPRILARFVDLVHERGMKRAV
jgi:GMP synthase (glutamine-hydrolysing)